MLKVLVGEIKGVEEVEGSSFKVELRAVIHLLMIVLSLVIHDNTAILRVLLRVQPPWR